MEQAKIGIVQPEVTDLGAEELAAVEKLQKGCCDYDEDGLRTLWRTAQRELGIPKVVPVKTGGRKVCGVGPETPD